LHEDSGPLQTLGALVRCDGEPRGAGIPMQQMVFQSGELTPTASHRFGETV